MAQVISTIFFNGQFWIALVEKYEDDGSLYVGRYTFGPEPTNSDLLDFYSSKYARLRFYKSEQPVRIKKTYSPKELDRNSRKSFVNFKIGQKKYLTEKKKARNIQKRETGDEKYRQKVRKRKEKKRGH